MKKEGSITLTKAQLESLGMLAKDTTHVRMASRVVIEETNLADAIALRVKTAAGETPAYVVAGDGSVTRMDRNGGMTAIYAPGDDAR